MKILTGELRGRAISFSPNPHLRPTADKVRKALFDMLQGALEDKFVLDIFSGTGALGLEALSGGAASATFLEKDRIQCRRIQENIDRLGLKTRSRVFCGDAEESLKRLSRDGKRFDIIFLDAPYGLGIGLRTLEALSALDLLISETLVFFECNRREEIPESVGCLRLEKEKVYGDTKVRVYRTS
jgi:16S rRNA (guanine(966)-N(2))-methyltransferase RsmD